MRQRMIQFVTVMFAALVITTAAWADTSPIGILKAQGKVTIEAPASTFTLTDQEYAYFSGDAVITRKGSQARIALSEGLNVTFVGAAEGNVSRDDGVYNIDVQLGHVLVEADSGTDYQVFHDGEIVSPDQPLNASATRFVVSVAETGEVQFYMPAQLDDDEDDDDRAVAGLRGSLERAGISAGQIAVIIAAIFGAVAIFDDDDGPPIPDVPIPDEPIPDVPIPDDDGPSS